MADRRGQGESTSKDSQRRLAICSVKLSMYICRVAFPDDSLSVSLSTALTRSISTARRINAILRRNHDVWIPLRSS